MFGIYKPLCSAMLCSALLWPGTNHNFWLVLNPHTLKDPNKLEHIQWRDRRNAICPVGDKASPDMASRFLEDWVGGGRSDWDAVSCIIGRRLLKKSVTLVLVASWVREVKTEICLCGVIKEETRCQRRWGTWSGSQTQTLGMLEHNLFCPYPRLKLQRFYALDWHTVKGAGHSFFNFY